MQKICFISLLSLLWLPFLQAQTIFYVQTNAVIDRPCPGDSTVVVTQPHDWLMYQTTNGLWDGPVDTSRCISATDNGNSIRIDLGQINPDAPLFLRTTPEAVQNAAPFNANWVHTALACVSLSSNNVSLLTGSDCPGNLCTGAHIGIRIPDENGNPGGAIRWHDSQTGNFPAACGAGIETCFPTEYFSNQTLAGMVLQYTFQPGSTLDGQFMEITWVEIQGNWTEPGYITQVNAYPQHLVNGEYFVSAFDASDNPGWGSIYLLRYTAPDYPSAATPSYVEGQPVPNSTEQKTVNLVINTFENLEVQPFTYLRGALVEGSDTLRHQLNLLNDGGEICFNFVDLVFGKGTRYRHAGGHIDMNNAFSCMQFRAESALRVEEGASLYYGDAGVGMLALCAGSTIELEKNAELVFDGVLNLSECNDALPPQQIFMDLPSGARLTFTEKAHLTNRFSKNAAMCLNVRMLGGELDDIALPEADRALIRRIYPEPSGRLADDIGLAPNPFASAAALRYIAADDEQLRLEWIGVTGQIVSTQTLTARRGLNEWQVYGPEAAGMYWLHVGTARGSVIRKVVKME